MDPVTMYAIGAGVGAIGSWLTGSSRAREEKKRRRMEQKMEQQRINLEQSRRRAGTAAIQGYGGYQAYQSPILAQYLSGQLTPAQQAVIGQQQRVGEATIARRGASMGMPSGAQAGLYGQLSRDISLGAGQLSGQQQQLGLQYSMADWARQQEAAQWKAAQLAQYAY